MRVLFNRGTEEGKVGWVLLWRLGIPILMVQVKTFKGTAQLSGFVNSRDQKNRAGDIAKRVEGVHNVENNITVKE